MRSAEFFGQENQNLVDNAWRHGVEQEQGSLEELGQLAGPPLAKDAVAGRIRRLLAMADKKAAQEGLPGTDVGLNQDLLDGA